jgi:hypothetical protein
VNLTEFLLARIAEDESLARAQLAAGRQHGTSWDYNDPRRCLAECEAKRQIVEHADTVSSMDRQIESEWGTRSSVPWDEDEGIRLLRLLALPYADHPDYDQTWRPES